MDLKSEEYRQAVEGSRKSDYSIVSNELRLRIAKSNLTSSEHNVLIVIEVGIGRMYAKTRKQYYVSMTHREIMEAVGAKSKGTISKALKGLVDKRILLSQSNGKGSYDYGLNTEEWDADLEKFYDMFDEAEKEMENNMAKGEIDWADFDSSGSKPKRKRVDKNILDNWTFNDFGKYILSSYSEVLKESDVSIDSSTFRTSASRVRNMNLSQIVSDLFEMSGDVYCKIVLKAYIDWFGKRRLLDIYKEVGFISIKLLRDVKFMKDFLQDNSILDKGLTEEQLKETLCMYDLEVVNNEISEGISQISIEDLDACSELGLTRFMESYGIVVAANYLYYKSKFSEEKILKSMDKFFNKMKNGNIFHKTSVQNIVKNTLRYCPYRDDMILLDWQKRYKSVSKLSKDWHKKMNITSASEDKIYGIIVE
jgi:hypothetical protein